jgi:hypothetical protein
MRHAQKSASDELLHHASGIGLILGVGIVKGFFDLGREILLCLPDRGKRRAVQASLRELRRCPSPQARNGLLDRRDDRTERNRAKRRSDAPLVTARSGASTLVKYALS